MILASKNTNGEEELLFYKYDYDSGLFVEDKFAKTKIYPRNCYIQNLVANDLNNDGHLDIVITIYDTNSEKRSSEVHIFDPDSRIFKERFTTESSGIVIGDFDGDRL